MELSELKKLTDSDQREYGKSLIISPLHREAEFYNSKWSNKKQLGGSLDCLYCSEAFPVCDKKYLKISIEEDQVMNGSLTTYHQEGDVDPECEMTWTGYISVAHDGDLHLTPINRDAHIEGTITDVKTKQSYTFAFQDIYPVAESPYPEFLCFH